MRKPFSRFTGIIPVETIAAGTLVMPDGRPVYAISDYASPPADGRPLRRYTTDVPTDGRPRIGASLYANGVLVTPDGRPVHAVILS